MDDNGQKKYKSSLKYYSLPQFQGQKLKCEVTHMVQTKWVEVILGPFPILEIVILTTIAVLVCLTTLTFGIWLLNVFGLFDIFWLNKYYIILYT